MALPNSNSGAGHIPSIDALIDRSRALGYVMDRSLGTALYLLVRLGKPLLIEGHAVVGRPEAANVLASILGEVPNRPQCCDELGVKSAAYEWNYQRQAHAITMQGRSTHQVQN